MIFINSKIKINVAVICLITVVMTSCNGHEEIKVNNADTKLEQTNSCIYDKALNYNYFDMKKVTNTRPYYYIMTDNGLLATTRKEKGNNSIRNNLNVAYEDYFFIDYLSGEKTTLDMDKLTGEEDFEKLVAYSADNKQYLTYASFSDAIDVYDSDWKYIKEIKLDFLNSKNSTFTIDRVENERVYLHVLENVDSPDYKCELCIVDYDGKIIFKRDDIIGYFLGNDLIINQSNEAEEESDSDNVTPYAIERINDDKLTKLEGYDVCNDENFLGYYSGDDSYDFYGLYILGDNTYLMGCNSNEAEFILNLKDYGYPGFNTDNDRYDIDDIYSAGNGDYILVIRDVVDNRLQILSFSLSEEQTAEKIESEKQEIMLLCECENPNWEMYVQSYNNQSPDYEIRIRYFDEYINEEKNNLNIFAGDDIDGLVLSEFGNETYTNSGILNDLNNYFEHSTKVNKEDFLNNVQESFTNEDGSIYQLYPYYYLEGYVAKNDAVISDYFEYTSQSDSTMSVIANGNWYNIISGSINSFVDIENKNINLGNIQKLIENVKEQEKKFPFDANLYEYELVQGDKSRFMINTIYDYSSYFEYEKLLNDNITVSCFDNEAANIIPCCINISVMQNSNNKEGMYDFLDYIYSDENYAENFNSYEATPNVSMSGFPVLKNSWQDIITYLKSTDEYTDRLGVIREFNGVATSGSHNIPYSIDEEEVDKLDELVRSAEYVKPLDENICNVIFDEADLYFDDEQDIDKTMSNIEKKINDILRDY